MRILKTAGMIAALSAAVLLGGCSIGGGTASSTPTATATATNTPAPAVPTPASGFTTFTSSDGVYGLNYPNTWTQVSFNTSPVVNGAIFVSAADKAYFMVLPLNQSLPADQYGAFAKSFAGGFGGTGTQVSATTTTATFASKTWTEVDGTTTLKSTASEVKVFGTPLGSNTLFIVMIWPTATGSQVNTAYLQPMLNSFTILKQS